LLTAQLAGRVLSLKAFTPLLCRPKKNAARRLGKSEILTLGLHFEREETISDRLYIRGDLVE